MNKKTAYILAGLSGLVLLLVGAGVGFVLFMSNYVSDQINQSLAEFAEENTSAFIEVGGLQVTQIGKFDIDFWNDTLSLDQVILKRLDAEATFTDIRFDGLQLSKLYPILSQEQTSENDQEAAFLEYLALPLDMHMHIGRIIVRSEAEETQGAQQNPAQDLLAKGVTMSFEMGVKNTPEGFKNSLHFIANNLIELRSVTEMTPIPPTAIKALNNEHLGTLAFGAWLVNARYEENTTTITDLGFIPHVLDIVSNKENLPKDDNYQGARLFLTEAIDETVDAYQDDKDSIGSPASVAALKQALARFTEGGKTLSIRHNDKTAPITVTSLDYYDISVE